MASSQGRGEAHIPDPESVEVGSKRKRRPTDPDLPPKPKKVYPKRAKCWEHFIQRVDDPSKSNCRHCGHEIGCDSKLVGTSAMNGHLSRCKELLDFEAREKQKILSGDNSGKMKLILYDLDRFRKSVNKLVVVNELHFSFVESAGWKQFCFDVLPMYNTFSRRTCTKDVLPMYNTFLESLDSRNSLATPK